MSDETITFNLELNAAQLQTEVRKLELLLFRSLDLLSRLGLPEEIDAAITKIQRLVMTIRLLHSAIIAIQAASGPIGWALAGIGIAVSVLSTGELISDTLYDTTRGTP